jgi:hypothetical protein
MYKLASLADQQLVNHIYPSFISLIRGSLLLLSALSSITLLRKMSFTFHCSTGHVEGQLSSYVGMYGVVNEDLPA